MEDRTRTAAGSFSLVYRELFELGLVLEWFSGSYRNWEHVKTKLLSSKVPASAETVLCQCGFILCLLHSCGAVAFYPSSNTKQKENLITGVTGSISY